MKSILTKILVLIFAILIINIPNTSYAMGNMITSGDNFLKIGAEQQNQNQAINEEALQKASNDIYNILFAIAVVLAFAVGMIIGIQFFVGSVEEQAKVKETLVPYIIGVFIVFASFTIWKIAADIGNEVVEPAEIIRTTYTEDEASGKKFCGNCGEELTHKEQLDKQCSNPNCKAHII